MAENLKQRVRTSRLSLLPTEITSRIHVFAIMAFSKKLARDDSVLKVYSNSKTEVSLGCLYPTTPDLGVMLGSVIR